MTQINQTCPFCRVGNFLQDERSTGAEYGTTNIAELYSCGHVALSVILPNNVITEPLLINIVHNPIDDVKKAYDEKDYIKAITYACAVIEYLGKRILIKEFKNRSIQVGKKRLVRLSLNSVLVLLYSHNLIDQTTYQDILTIKDYRNDIMHIDRYEGIHLQLFAEGDNVAKKAVESLTTIASIAGKFEP